MSFHYICEVNNRSPDVENLHHVLINRSDQHGVCVQQAADGSHGDGPVEQPAAHQDAAPGEELFLLQTHMDETFVLVGLLEVSLWEILDFIVDPESSTDGFDALLTCRAESKSKSKNYTHILKSTLRHQCWTQEKPQVKRDKNVCNIRWVPHRVH